MKESLLLLKETLIILKQLQIALDAFHTGGLIIIVLLAGNLIVNIIKRR